MSVQRRGDKWVVRWKEAGQHRSRSFRLKEDADRVDLEAKRRAALGILVPLDAGSETLDEYVESSWAPGHTAHLAAATRALYAHLYDGHISPALGRIPLRELNADRIAAWQAGLKRSGVGTTTIRKAHTLLGSILRAALASGRIQSNPQRHVRRIPADQREETRPLAPAAVERLRAVIGAEGKGRKDVRWMRERDRALVSLLAYAGLRPQEARGLRWRDVGEATLHVRAPKTRSARSVRLLGPLKADLAAWRLAQGRPGPDEPVIPGAGGEAWSASAYANWRSRTWAQALEAAGIEPCRPYALRHSFASLLAHEGRSVVYIARQLGHSAEESLRTYQHVVEELEDQPRLSAEEAIRAARRQGADERTGS